MAGHNKVEQLQAAMEKQDYNPFGRFYFYILNLFKILFRPGGGGPNKKIINSNNQNPSNNNNYNNNYNNVNSGGGGRMESKKQEISFTAFDDIHVDEISSRCSLHKAIRAAATGTPFPSQCFVWVAARNT